MHKQDLNSRLLAFLKASPTPFHAVRQMVEQLEAAHYERLLENQSWNVNAGGRYYVTRNDSSIVAFRLGTDQESGGMRMMGAHTDSPCLKVKPLPDTKKAGYWQLGVEVYGGALLNPWFDRDLSLAGRVTFVEPTGSIQSTLVDFERPLAVIPSLAIHLDRDANSKRSVNPQTHMPPILQLALEDEEADFRNLLNDRLTEQGVSVGDTDKSKGVLDFDICLYDTQPPSLVGLKQEFIASARLDNLLSCFVAMQALLDSKDQVPALLVCNDHEEVGSGSAAGAQGTLLGSVLERISPDREQMSRTIADSMMISVDNAHGIHPNYANKHDENHGPLLNQGPVIKVNASQRYASNSETSAVFRQVCEQGKVPLQAFVVRSDMACGSTIGPITATEIGVRTLDIGVPTFAMHSIRELAGAKDTGYLYEALKAYCELEQLP